ncbi:hypothetical protein [Lacrimispora indolis]|uniref:hypothetical protein n=1 Tax=Lacrimispora indolis TaxID=69825 RepID=UPI00045E7D87|nr:hypothetical protein [Lacrimispora indolis]
MKKFVIVPEKKYYFFSDIHDDDIYIEEEPFVAETNKVIRTFQRMLKRFGLWRIYLLFLGNWKLRLKECDECIIFDQAFSLSIVKIIRQFNSNVNIHIYLWNPTFKDISIVKKLKKVSTFTHVCSFDKSDCEKYGFTFSPMIYDFNAFKEKAVKFEYDVIFVGYLKNRVNMLTEIYNQLKAADVKNYFYVLDNNNNTETVPFELKKGYLDYRVYRNLMLSSKAVLDIVQDGQIGLTIRTMETICFEKKLITNNKDIMNYDFYNSNNIFVIGVDSLDNLTSFINTPFEKINEEIIRKYNFVDWVKSFSDERG